MALFLALVKLLDLGVAGVLDHCYEENEYGESGGNLMAYLHQETCDTLFLGASRVQNQVDPKIFGPEAYTLAYQQMHILYLTALVDILEQRKKLPKDALIVQIEVEDFLAGHDDRTLSDIHHLRYHYHENDYVRKYIQRQSKLEFLKYTFSSFRHNQRVLSLLSDYWQRKDQAIGIKGYYPLTGHLNKKDSLKDQPLMVEEKNLAPSPLAKSCLQHLQSICQRNQLNLIVFTAPLYKVNKAYREFSTYFASELKHRQIPYLNYNSDSLNPNYPIKYWYDTKHLNEKGAPQFGIQLKKDLKYYFNE
ncbi:MAG: hypothetical protein EP338_04945 [Bacteroidetes bacterium]|nr:MAG: hypothetical protein EP338_04945 [Bacteroidota bacterium]